jgi:uncharacterized protein (UPF0333 family)
MENNVNDKAQVMVEFSFCMIIVMLMIYGMIKIFGWSAIDLVKRNRAFENSLLSSNQAHMQIRTPVYNEAQMNLVFDQ